MYFFYFFGLVCHIITLQCNFIGRVVCVGGDGMFSEIIHGLISRAQRDAGVDHNRSDETLIPCSLRIGIIPAGESSSIKVERENIFDFFIFLGFYVFTPYVHATWLLTTSS